MAVPIWQTSAGSLGTINEREYFTTSVIATDVDTGTLTYNLQSGRLPRGLELVSTGIIRGTPFDVDLDTESKFTIRVSDNTNIADRSFSITITGNDEPVFTTNPGQVLDTFDCREVEFQILVTDLDPGDIITYRLIGGELPPGMSLNENTGLISGFIPKTSPNEAPLNVLVLQELRGFENNIFFDIDLWDTEENLYVTHTLISESKL